MTMLHKEEEVSNEWDITSDDNGHIEVFELPLRILLLIFWLFHAVVQSLQIKDDGFLAHVKHTQNQVDLMAYALVLTVIICRQLLMSDMISADSVRIIGSLTGLMLWIQIIFWLRLFDSTAKYVALLLRTIKDISYFMIVMAMLMFGFATAFFILQYSRVYNESDADSLLFPMNKGDSIMGAAFVNQYLMMLGDFEGVNLSDESSSVQVLVTIYFIFTTFLVQITILNMLIAIMGQTFSEHMEEQDV